MPEEPLKFGDVVQPSTDTGSHWRAMFVAGQTRDPVDASMVTLCHPVRDDDYYKIGFPFKWVTQMLFWKKVETEDD